MGIDDRLPSLSKLNAFTKIMRVNKITVDMYFILMEQIGPRRCITADFQN